MLKIITNQEKPDRYGGTTNYSKKLYFWKKEKPQVIDDHEVESNCFNEIVAAYRCRKATIGGGKQIDDLPVYFHARDDIGRGMIVQEGLCWNSDLCITI
jgi:hypothetical protein